MFSLILKKERFKFSSSHFTIFDDKNSESLHGHNYNVEAQIDFKEVDKTTGLAIDFNEIKSIIQKYCDFLDEKILLPQRSHLVEIKTKGSQLEVHLHNRFYSLPKQECLSLPLVNISSEQLAFWMHHQISLSLGNKPALSHLSNLKITIFETRGQGASYEGAPKDVPKNESRV